MKEVLFITLYVLFIIVSLSVICTLLTAADTLGNILGVVCFFIFIYLVIEFGVKLLNYNIKK